MLDRNRKDAQISHLKMAKTRCKYRGYDLRIYRVEHLYLQKMLKLL